MHGADPPRARSTEQLWAAFADPLRRFIRKRVGHEADAEDILQTVFAKIHGRLSQLRAADKVAPWMYRIARNAVIDHVRARAATPESTDLPHDLADDAQPPAVLHELAECVRPMIDQLAEPYRQALLLAEIDGLTQRELAQRLGLSLSGAKSRVQRGREHLKALILDCCHVELDRRGGVVDFEPRSRHCRRCAPPSGRG